ncbi:MAG: isoaspartyl peptidase/L-asparaginase [Myxococcota bacterium]
MTPIVVVHGGAGAVAPERRQLHVDGCVAAADAGRAVVVGAGTALDAAVAAVAALERNPCFNAGIGSSLTAEGHVEQDAAVMRGEDLAFGGVCAVQAFVHPIQIAAAVLREGRHCLYAGRGARRFAEAQGFRTATEHELITDRARDRLRAVLEGAAEEGWAGGTVGAVAMDADGRLAAATSTGGTVGKAPGRVGDSPLIGAGTYAEDGRGACSATGVGEAILRFCLARRVVESVADEEDSPNEKIRSLLSVFRTRVRGSGGIIALDSRGTPILATTTDTMTHAVARGDEPAWGQATP